jgi:hypothetical protein
VDAAEHQAHELVDVLVGARMRGWHGRAGDVLCLHGLDVDFARPTVLEHQVGRHVRIRGDEPAPERVLPGVGELGRGQVVHALEHAQKRPQERHAAAVGIGL